MKLVGVLEDASMVFTQQLEHGADPRTSAFDHGYLVTRPLNAVRSPDGTIELRLLVRPVSGEDGPERVQRQQDDGLAPEDLAQSERRQRIAAYALVRSSAGLLATEFSERTAVAGHWGLPGGGIDEHEQPAEAVLREVYEETRQVITLGALLEVQTSHWVGRSPSGVIEDYHAIRLVYLGVCDQPDSPVVLDVGGTTESAAWVSLDRWHDVAWTVGWRQILEKHLPASS